MHRAFFILWFVLHCPSCLVFCQPACTDGDMVEEYRETKNGITLFTTISLHDSAQRLILNAFLTRLSKALKRPRENSRVLILVDYKTHAWKAAIGFDTLKFDYGPMADYYDPPRLTGDTEEVIIKEIADDDILHVTNYQPPKAAPSWTISNDKTEGELGLRILYKSPQSDCSVYFDRIYSLTQYGIDHCEKVKKEQKRMKMEYDGYLLSVLSIDTTEIKSIPLESLGFSPNHIEVETKSKGIIWVGATIILLVPILFFFLKRRRSNTVHTKQ